MGIRELKDQADALFARGKFGRCAEVYREILQREPLDPRGYFRHAESCRRSGNVEQAVLSYRTAAGLLARSGHLVRAQAALRVAAGLAPQDGSLRKAIHDLEERRHSNPAGAAPDETPSGVRPWPRPKEVPLDEEPPAGAPPSVVPASVRRLSPWEVAVRLPDGEWMVLYSKDRIQARPIKGAAPPPDPATPAVPERFEVTQSISLDCWPDR
ncbi:MAG: tetratricopeptide repeat protein [Myxococcaceae bacterium]